MPLKALLNGNEFYSWNLAEKDRKLDFRCPHCPERLIPILPIYNIIKHFRHKSGAYHVEPETPAHLAGKQLIYETAKEIGIPVSLEVRLGSHITDVFLDGNEPTAIEFQCSNISEDEIRERTVEYTKVGAHRVLWILGGHFYTNAKSFTIWKRIDKENREILSNLMASNLTTLSSELINSFPQYKSYKIQRITKAERYIGDLQGNLFYLDGKSAFTADWKPRFRSKTLGWYRLRFCSLKDILGGTYG